MKVAVDNGEAKTMSPTSIFSRHWKQVTLLIMVMFVVGTFIGKTPGAAVRAETAVSGVRHLMHDANTDRREVRPIPLIG
jgi:hypothetical protein